MLMQNSPSRCWKHRDGTRAATDQDSGNSRRAPTALGLFDILPAASGEDSYGARFKSGLFGGFLPQPPYFSGGQRRGFTFGLSAHRSCGQEKYRAVGRKKKRALYPRPEVRGFTARAVRRGPLLFVAVPARNVRFPRPTRPADRYL